MSDIAPTRVLEKAGASVLVYSTAELACQAAADRLAETLKTAVATRGRAVLGLATGSTPEPIYAQLVAKHRAGELSFAQAVSYNLDEYYPISPLDPNSYRAYMHQHLFRHVDLPAHQAHVLDGTVPEFATAEHAAQFDRWISEDGGFDLQLLGIGRNGHIGFNEPADLPLEKALALPTRLVELDSVTRADAVKQFGDASHVLHRALTVGVAQILAARSILIVALGTNKAPAVGLSLNGPMTSNVPASLLQAAPGKVTWMIDEAAASEI